MQWASRRAGIFELNCQLKVSAVCAPLLLYIMIKSLFPHACIQNHIIHINPLTPMSDQDRISPYDINIISTR